MKHGFTAFVLAASVLAVGPAFAEDPEDIDEDEERAEDTPSDMAGNVQFFVGQRSMTSDLWRPLDGPTVFGIEVDFAPASSPIRVALGWHFASESGTATVTDPFLGDTGSIDSTFSEFSAGFLWHPVKKAVVRPYLGAGAVMMFAANTTFWNSFDSDGESDQSFGFYGNAGVFFKVGDSFNIGIDGRIVRGTSISLAGRELDADYEQLAMLFGLSWGK